MTEVITDNQTTFIQDMIDYLQEVLPQFEIFQSHEYDVYHTPPCVLVRYIDDIPYTAHWGGIESYDADLERLYYSYHSKVAFNIDCTSGLSYDEADRMSLRVVRALLAPNSDRSLKHSQMAHNIRFIPKGEVKRIYPNTGGEEGYWRFVVMVTADMEFREYVETPKLTSAEYDYTINVP